MRKSTLEEKLTEVVRLRVRHYSGRKLSQKELDKCVKALRRFPRWYLESRVAIFKLADEMKA